MKSGSLAAILAALALACTAAWAADNTLPANSQAKKQVKKAAPNKQVQRPVKKKKAGNAQTRALENTTKSESRKHNTLSKSSQSRHDQTQNTVRNKR